MSYWRHYTVISILMQMGRIPIAMALVSKIESLNIYFVVMASSLPVQFLSAEFISYRGTHSLKARPALIAIMALMLASVAFLYLKHGIAPSAYLAIYSASLLLMASASSEIRQHHGATAFIKSDAILNTSLSFLTISTILLSDESFVSELILSATIICNTIYWAIARNGKENTMADSPAFTCNGSGLLSQSFYFQIALMATTQLERLFIGYRSPAFLGLIAIAGALSQVWRRMTLDDAIVFEKLRNLDKPWEQLSNTTAHYLAWSILATGGLALSAGLIPYLHQLELLSFSSTRSLDVHHIQDIALISGLYISSLPCGIVAINILRDGRFSPTKWPWLYITLTSTLIATLIGSGGRNLDWQGYVWLVIFLNANTNLVLYYDFFSTYHGKPPIVFWKAITIFIAFSFIIFSLKT